MILTFSKTYVINRTIDTLISEVMTAALRTAFATYKGRDDFREKFPATAFQNVGSQMYPVTIRSCTV